MKNLSLIGFLLLFLTTGCNSKIDNRIEITQKHRENIVDVSGEIIDIKPEILIGRSMFYIIDSILIVAEMEPKGEMGIHLFNKNTFEYIRSTGFIGRGPGEIGVMGRLGIDSKNRIIWAPDHGKRIVYKFPLDSVLNNEQFKPSIRKELNNELFIERFGFLNDSIVLGKAVHAISASSFDMAMAKLNINTNEIEKFGYEHPQAIGKKSNSLFALSVEGKFYVNCYYYLDLMTICDLEGNLKHNVYGPGWFENDQDKNAYFSDVGIIGDKIIASYIGGRGIIIKDGITKGATPSKLIVFNKEGTYLKTIETSNVFTRFCIDEENRRIIAYFLDREEAMGYFDIPLD
jgi:hypothetical protein